MLTEIVYISEPYFESVSWTNMLFSWFFSAFLTSLEAESGGSENENLVLQGLQENISSENGIRMLAGCIRFLFS